ncbi:hypothetical protein, partial [uncultured Chloroflexus sp.]|uniref:hypothetical protein n=1 Tax=uncultured Chloroflexus sp. TaxID=214040 RepID=UPI00262F444A
SRGFWFFEAARCNMTVDCHNEQWFQSPHGDFGFLKAVSHIAISGLTRCGCFNPLTGILVF